LRPLQVLLVHGGGFGVLLYTFVLGPRRWTLVLRDPQRRSAYSMPCRANRFEPIGMTSDLLGAVLPILPSGPSYICKSLRTVPQISLAQKAQNAMPHDQGALMHCGNKYREPGVKRPGLCPFSRTKIR
jgi:hypothetical protein